MLLVLFLLLSSLPQQPNKPNQIIGTWINQDPATRGITLLLIEEQSGQLQVHAWGACVPTDCDWGMTDLHFADGVATGVFDMGFAVERVYLIRLPNDKLLAVDKSEFKDGSNRVETDHAEIFVRQEESQPPASIDAKNLLKTVAETYRTLSAAQFEFEEVSDMEDQVVVAQIKTTLSRPDKWRTETSENGEARTLISDGHTVWTFFPESNEYTTHPAERQQSAIDSYGLLDKMPGSARITGSEFVRDVNCTVLIIGRPNRTRTLWIDPKTKLIRMEKLESKSPTTGLVLQSVTISFSVARTLPNVDDQLFLFDPQKTHAKLRTELQEDGHVKRVGTPAPDFSLLDLEGQVVKLSQLKGKVVLLNFWAIWCPACRTEMPNIELLHREFKDKGLVVLGIDHEEAQKQNAFLKEFGFSFTSLVEPRKQASNLYGVGGIPTTVVIDQQGTIKVYDVGIASYESLRETLHKMGVH